MLRCYSALVSAVVTALLPSRLPGWRAPAEPALRARLAGAVQLGAA